MNEAVKECCRLVREARSHWNAHENGAARRVRSRAMEIYDTLTPEEKDEIPQVLRQWLRYRSEFYLGRPKKKRKNAPNPVPAKKRASALKPVPAQMKRDDPAPANTPKVQMNVAAADATESRHRAAGEGDRGTPS